jgi:hypothetical protein
MNIFEKRNNEIEGELGSNSKNQEDIARKKAELGKLKQLAEDQEVELLGEQITTEIAVKDAKNEEEERRTKVDQMKADFQAKIIELEALGLNTEPLKQALEKLSAEKELSQEEKERYIAEGDALAKEAFTIDPEQVRILGGRDYYYERRHVYFDAIEAYKKAGVADKIAELEKRNEEQLLSY